MGACELLLSVVEGLSGLGQVDHHHHDELMIMLIMTIMRSVMIILTDMLYNVDDFHHDHDG